MQTFVKLIITVFYLKSLILHWGVEFTFPFIGRRFWLEEGFSRVKRPTGQTPVDNNDEKGADGEDENDHEAPEDTRDKGSSKADEEEKKCHLNDNHRQWSW